MLPVVFFLLLSLPSYSKQASETSSRGGQKRKAIGGNATPAAATKNGQTKRRKVGAQRRMNPLRLISAPAEAPRGAAATSAAGTLRSERIAKLEAHNVSKISSLDTSSNVNKLAQRLLAVQNFTRFSRTKAIFRIFFRS